MACGLPVIVTGHGAALDFCDGERAYLIPAEEVRMSAEKRTRDFETVDYPWWANPDGEALKDLLLHVLNNPAEAGAKAQKAMSFIRANFSWEQSAQAARHRIEQLRQQPVLRFLGKAQAADTVIILTVDSPDQFQYLKFRSLRESRGGSP